MPKCSIDIEASPTFSKLFKFYSRQYKQARNDLTKAFEKIEEDYSAAAQARRVQGAGGTIWKYRWKSTDLQRGASGAWRIIAHYEESTNTLYPLFIYLKTEMEDVSKEKIEQIVDELREQLQDS